MTRGELLDILALCENGEKGLRRGIALAWRVWRLSARAATGVCEKYQFNGLNFDCLNPWHVPFLYTEIFVAEPYDFLALDDRPYIIDGGVNIGMSLAYFKKKYPGSHVVGFEPHPDAYRVALQNVQRNRLQNVTLMNAALTPHGDNVLLNYIPEEILASTVSTRLAVRGEKAQNVKVSAVRLSEYLDKDVDFLKLDIEGSEYGVLAEAGGRLRKVRNMFVEFHVTRGDSSNDLAACLRLLTDAGYDYLITSTLSNRRTAAIAPLKRCGPVSSVSIHARRID